MFIKLISFRLLNTEDQKVNDFEAAANEKNFILENVLEVISASVHEKSASVSFQTDLTEIQLCGAFNNFLL